MTDVLGPDVYHANVDLIPAARIAADPRFGFAVIKATEGVAYPWATTWFPQNWKAIGDTRLARGAYHFLIVRHSGKEQAEFFLQTVEANGGFRDTDLHPIVDVEWKLNDGATPQQVTDCVEEYAATMHAEGHKLIRYGRSMFLDLGITSALGCDFSWVPRYNDELGSTAEIGFPEPDLWQYGNGQFNFTSWPDAAPGLRPGDMNVVLTDLDRLTVGGAAPAGLAAARGAGPGAAGDKHRPTPATWSDEDWEASRRTTRGRATTTTGCSSTCSARWTAGSTGRSRREPGARRAGWRHEDDLIALRKAAAPGGEQP